MGLSGKRPIPATRFSFRQSHPIISIQRGGISLDERYIEIKAAKAKTRQRRLVTISDNLAEWLKPYVKTEGRVAPSANQDVFGEYLKDIAQASGITEWPHNAMRHSFGSYFYAKTKEEIALPPRWEILLLWSLSITAL